MEKTRTIRTWGSFLLLLLLLFVFLIWNVLAGSVKLPVSEILEILRGRGDGTQSRILLQIRLPRLLSALILGGALSLSGIYQPRKDGSIRFPVALEQYLKDNPGVARIVLCLDNDEPGRAASAAIQKRLSEYEVIDNPPRSGKDYNDQLQMVKGISGRVRTRGGDAR